MALVRMEHTGAAPATGLASGINNSVTSFSILSGTGYPTGAVGPFILCLDPGTGSEEKVLCSGRTGTTVTVAGGGRGYDGTAAAAHSSGTTNVQHVLGAIEVDDDNDHLYTTTRDDHSQYVRTDGTRAITGAQTLSAGATVTTGGLTVSAGGLTVSAGTTAVQALTATTITGTGALTGVTTITGTGVVQGTLFDATGVTGAALQARFVGAISGGPPTTGAHAAGDLVMDTLYGITWVCTLNGTPGTWSPVGSGNLYALVYRNTAWTTTSSSGAVVAYDTAVADPNTMVNLSTGVATVPIAGVYHVIGVANYTTSATTQINYASILQNSSTIATTTGSTSGSGALYGQALVECYAVCSASDTLKINLITSTNALTGTTGQARTFMHIRFVQ